MDKDLINVLRLKFFSHLDEKKGFVEATKLYNKIDNLSFQEKIELIINMK